jgi:hypothetical protein
MVPVMLEMDQTHDREEMAYVQGAGRRVESGIDVEGPRSERLLGTIGEIPLVILEECQRSPSLSPSL